MGKKFTPSEETVFTILDDNTIDYRIPLNQRKYDWNIEQIEDFWNDINRIIDTTDSHYLGVISIIEKKLDGDIRRKTYEVVDGQQRIITIMLLLSAIRDFYIGLNKFKRAERIQERYFYVQKTSEIYEKIESSRIDKYTFNSFVNIGEIIDNNEIRHSFSNNNFDLSKKENRKIKDKKDEFLNTKIIDSYNYFFSKILESFNETEDIENYLSKLEKVLERLELILIISSNKEDLFLFFDSLNNRGLQLNQMDIIRNSLLGITSKNFDQKNTSTVAELWDELTIRLDEFDKIKFLKYYYICAEEKIFNSKSLPDEYDKFFDNFSNFKDLKLEINKMIEYADIFCELYSKKSLNQISNEFDRNILAINRLGQQACYSFLMDYFYYIEDENRRNKVTRNIRNLMFRRIISKKSVKKLDGIFRGLIKLKENNSYEDEMICQKIKFFSPNDNEFKSIFKDKEWDTGSITYYTLEEMEYLKNKNDNIYDRYLKERKKVTLEHIIPNQETNYWEEKFLDNQQTFNKPLYKLYTTKIGNLLLLEEKINKSIKNKEYEFKYEKYKDSDAYLVKDFIKSYSKSFNKDIIDQRTKDLAEVALKIWKI